MRSSTGANSSIPLPSFPKFDDSAVRSKWAKEYDRVEAELLHHHLQPAANADEPNSGKSSRHQQQQQQEQISYSSQNTVVLSLRHMESNWSREPPSEPLKDPVPVRRKKKNTGPFFRSGSRADRRSNNSPADEDDTSGFYKKISNNNSAEEDFLAMNGIAARSSAVGALSDPSSFQRSNKNNNNNSPTTSGAAEHPSPVRSSSVAATTSNPYDLARWTRVLDAIVHPPVQYRASLNVLGSEGWELNWLKPIGRTDRIPSLLTLETLRDSIYQQPKDIALNSPRSILVMLKNGLAVSDLRPRTKDSFVNNDLPAKEQTIAYTHYERRRKAVIQSLKEEYRNMCSNLTLHDLIEGLISLREGREHARLHPQTPPVSMQPWSMSRSRVRASAATPQPGSNTNTNDSFFGNNNNQISSRGQSPIRSQQDDENNRPHSSMAGPISSSLRGFDLESQFRRAEIKKQKEQEINERKRQQEEHAKLVALRRQMTMLKIKEHQEQVQAKAEERQKVLDAHVEQVEKKKMLERKKIAEREKKRSQHRTVILAQARQQEEDRKERIVRRIDRENQAIARVKEQKEAQHKTENAIRHQQNADRLFLGTRHRRAAEFKKLFTVAEIADKADRAEHASVSRKYGTSPSPDRDHHEF